MIRITESIIIDAPVEEVFDAERNITLHTQTQEHHGERAVAGVTEGLINLGEEVEWEARHFFIRQRLRVRITHMDKPHCFRDEMIKGDFKSLSHKHTFKAIGPRQTEKRDVLEVAAPLGLLGFVAERLFLGRYMRHFMRQKNLALKKIIEARRFKIEIEDGRT